MMDASDAHLERALEEYNERVNELEDGGSPRDLLDAYVNRGCILMMMEYRTSAIEDLASADSLICEIEESGGQVDDGTFVRVYTSMGSVATSLGVDPLAAYSAAATRLPSVDGSSRHFDPRSVVRMCVDAASDLIDTGNPDASEPYTTRGIELAGRSRDHWSANRRLQLLNLRAEALSESGDHSAALDAYDEAVATGTELMSVGRLEDTEELVLSYVSKAECEESLGLTDMYIADTESAIALLEGLMECHSLQDTDVLVTLHQNVAGALMRLGRMDDAERHLVRAMTVGVRGAGEYIRDQVPNGMGN